MRVRCSDGRDHRAVTTRFSPLAQITKDNVRNLRLAYAVPLGGSAGNEWLESTPLVEDGFL
jgi:alcohol dehydrogenase (cytochrome c)